MRKKRSILNILMFCTVLLFGIMFFAITSKAQSKQFYLKYAINMPSSERVTAQTVYGTMSSTRKITVSVTSFSGDGTMYLSTSDGNMSLFVNQCMTGSSCNTVSGGKSVCGTAQITTTSGINSLLSSGTFSF